MNEQIYEASTPERTAEESVQNVNATTHHEEEVDEFVTFIIGEETFGVDVLCVHEIIGMTQITPVPNTLKYMKGVINMRGNVVPVVDMRIKFNLEEIDYTEITVIIIVEIMGRYVGMIVDTVSDVVDIPSNNIHDSTFLNINTQIESDFINSIGQSNGQLFIILNVEKILDMDDLNKFNNEI